MIKLPSLGLITQSVMARARQRRYARITNPRHGRVRSELES
jgi:hypothetical protein